MPIVLYVALGLVVTYLIFSIVASILVVKWMTHPKFDTREARKIRNQTKGFTIGTEGMERKDIVFIMSDGYEIHGDISLNNPKKFMVFGHGHASTREGSIRFARLFYPLGFSIVLYDHRGHGDNVRSYPTMGKLESKDMVQIVRQLKELYGADIEVGLFGCSMGAATTSLAVHELGDEVSFAIMDCPYSSLKNLVSGFFTSRHLPKYPTVWIINLLLKTFYKFSYKDIVCYKEKPGFNTPLCFIHGIKDKMVLCENSILLYNKSNTEVKVLKTFENSGHAECVELNLEQYKETIRLFLDKIGEKNGKETTKA